MVSALKKLVFERTVLWLTVLFAAGAGFLLWYQAKAQADAVEAMARENARASSEALRTFRSLYTSEVVDRLRHDVEIVHDYESRPGAIPLPATLSMKVGKSIGAEGTALPSRLYSPFPFPWRTDGGLRDDFGAAAWQALSDAPDDVFSRVEEVDGRLSLRYATADVMEGSCVGCHNSHAASVKTDWRTGDVRGVLEVIVPLDTAAERNQANLQRSVILFLGLGSIGVFGMGLVVGRLRRSAQLLERRVEERTSDLASANERLRGEVSARERAEREREALIGRLEDKNTELERFTYTVSHDLKSPLITISAFASMLGKNLAAGKTKNLDSDLRRIQDAAGSMRGLLEGLLELSRAGKAVDATARVDMGEVAREAVSLCAGRIEDKDVHVEIQSELPTVTGDRLRLLQVLQNLVDNAIKFTGEQARPRIEIGAEVIAGETVYFVKDNGAGIEPRHLENVFGLFEQLAPEAEGTGIGLALVQRIVDAHGGRIWVESEGLGHGTTFRFTLGDAAIDP